MPAWVASAGRIRHRTLAARRFARPGCNGAGHGHGPERLVVRTRSNGDRVDVRQGNRSIRHHYQGAVTSGRVDPRYRVRQCRGPDAGARCHTRRGAGNPRVDRRRQRAIIPAAAHRKRAAGVRRRGGWRAARLRVAGFAARHHSAVAAAELAGHHQQRLFWRSHSASPLSLPCSSVSCRRSNCLVHQ